MSETETIYCIASIEANKKKLQHVHDIMALALGVGAGVLTLESVYGFLFYIIGFTLTNLVFYQICCQGRVKEFFRKPLHEVFIDGIASNVAGFLMMWCLVFALVK